MIDHLDRILRTLFVSDRRLKELLRIREESEEELYVRFQPPDDAWRLYVTDTLHDKNALNVYMADLRENRKLRSNERVGKSENGMIQDEPAPSRMDCHYLITAWSPAQVTIGIEPTLDEHELLYQVVAVLSNKAPLNPSRIYPPESAALALVPEVIREAELPTQVLPAEGFPKLAEFWGTMGVNHRWKPAVYLVVTLPVVLNRQISGPMVTTRITDDRQRGRPETAEVWIQIGGHVRERIRVPGPPARTEIVPVAGAWVELESTTGETQTTETNDEGRFTFGDLRAGRYRLRARALGRGDTPPREIEVPSATGEYDLLFG